MVRRGRSAGTVGIHLRSPHATRAADMAGLQTDQATPDYTAGDSDRRAFNGYYRQLCEREGVRLAPTRCEQGAKMPRGFKLQSLCESNISSSLTMTDRCRALQDDEVLYRVFEHGKVRASVLAGVDRRSGSHRAAPAPRFCLLTVARARCRLMVSTTASTARRPTGSLASTTARPA